MLIKDWYLEKYSEDECGEDLLEELTFEDLFEKLENGIDVYTALFGNSCKVDSIIKNIILEELCNQLQIDYDFLITLCESNEN